MGLRDHSLWWGWTNERACIWVFEFAMCDLSTTKVMTRRKSALTFLGCPQ